MTFATTELRQPRGRRRYLSKSAIASRKKAKKCFFLSTPSPTQGSAVVGREGAGVARAHCRSVRRRGVGSGVKRVVFRYVPTDQTAKTRRPNPQTQQRKKVHRIPRTSELREKSGRGRFIFLRHCAATSAKLFAIKLKRARARLRTQPGLFS